MKRRQSPVPVVALLEGACPFLFLVLALASTLFLAWNVPPFMGADELAHIDRAYIGARGALVGERIESSGRVISGGAVSVPLQTAAIPFDSIRFRPHQKADVSDFIIARRSWAGPELDTDFRGAAMYPPMFYVPASLGMAAGWARNWPVVETLYFARACQAVVSCFVGFVALMLARRSRLFLYSVLMLPMSLALYAQITADGLLIATTALGCALICRARSEERPMEAWELFAAAACFASVGMTKPPYALFGLALLAVDAPLRRRAGAAIAILAVGVLWTLFTTLTVQTPLLREGANLDPGGQVARLLADPLRVADVARATLAANWTAYRMTVIGVLGWLDTPLPPGFYPAAWGMLAAAVAACASFGAPPAWRNLSWSVILLAAGVFGAIHGALYITWNPVGAPIVEGVAGRYFLPVLLFLGLTLEGRRRLLPETGPAAWPRVAFTTAILAFPLVTLLLVERVVILRYYLD